MGVGLGLKTDGVYVAFTAGTGIFAFIDLIALIIRQCVSTEIELEE